MNANDRSTIRSCGENCVTPELYGIIWLDNVILRRRLGLLSPLGDGGTIGERRASLYEHFRGRVYISPFSSLSFILDHDEL